MNVIIIRSAKSEDFEYICSYLSQLEGIEFDEAHLLNMYEENSSDEGNRYLVAEHKNTIIGSLSCHSQNLLHHKGRVGEVQEMFVREEYRSKQVGKLLLDEIKKIARLEKWVQLEVTSNKQRLRAIQFYEREGFDPTHEKFVWKPDQ